MAFNQSLINDRLLGQLVTWPFYWLALVLFCFVWNLGGAPLFDVDEGAFSEATREMLAHGDFLTTYLNGELRFDKPILIYWLQAAAVGTFGLHEWSFRLPSALAASGWVMAVLMFSRRFLNERSALLAATFTGTALGPLVIGRAATADALLHLCLAAALFDIYRFATSGERRCVLRTFLWMGIGTLTKGPVALLIPFLVSGIYFATRNDMRKWRRAIFDPLGWLILIVIAAPWYALEFREQGQAFVAGFFMKHNVGRFTATMQGHGGNLFYYAPAILLVTLPFSGLFLRILPALRQQWRDPLDRFLWLWFAVVYVLFSLSKTQLPHYILYGATPLFVLMARHRQLLRSRWLAYLPSILLLTALLLLPEIFTAVRERTHDVYVAEMLTAAPVIFDSNYRIGAALALSAVLRNSFRCSA
ncbi:MAG: glycosyltransferase family 39 protein [Pseudomonadota bacterium]